MKIVETDWPNKRVLKERLHLESRNHLKWTLGEIKEACKAKNQELNDHCIIEQGYEEGYYSDNNSYDGFFYLSVTEWFPMSEKEIESQRNRLQKLKDESENRSYQLYLKLKKKYEQKD